MNSGLRRLIVLAIGGATLAAATVNCFGAPIQWPLSQGGNGHYYDFIGGRLTWNNALADAQSQTFLGVPGNLATITSNAEREFLRDKIGLRRGWLGGFQDRSLAGFSEPKGGWRWITREPWEYTNWATDEPNNYSLNESYMEIDPAAGSPDRTGWNDAPDTFGANTGYYLEFAVPEPNMLPAMIAGVCLVLRRGRLRRHQ